VIGAEKVLDNVPEHSTRVLAAVVVSKIETMYPLMSVALRVTFRLVPGAFALVVAGLAASDAVPDQTVAAETGPHMPSTNAPAAPPAAINHSFGRRA
jgi:hypothetical protein